jgi:two-component system, LytTR family, sensor kinase
MLDLPSSVLLDESMANTNILLLHTVGAAAELTVSAILVRALYLLRRNGEAPRGFVSIAVLMSAASLARVTRLIFSWASPPPPYWLDAVTASLLLITILVIPRILSARYLPIRALEESTPSGASWLQWAMIGNAVGGIAIFVLVMTLRSRSLISLTSSVICTISAILLCIRASLFRNLQLRQRGLLLFSGLTTLGLLGISANLFYQYWGHVWAFGSVGTTASIELFYMFVVLGMMFVFASLRLADVIVKRVVGLYIWSVISLLVWGAVTNLDKLATTKMDQEAFMALLSVVLIGLAIGLTPVILRWINEWIDSWVFQVPDFNAAIQTFWEELLELESADEVYRAGEEIIRSTLSLAAVRIIALSAVHSNGDPVPFIGPNPYFVRTDSPFRSIVSPPADVLFPLVHEGASEHWIVLSYGVIRPPLTAAELNFVARIAAEIQVRIGTVVAEHTRLERLRRESTFREEIADAELRALRAQINPHFLFNSLNTIADLSIVAPGKAEEMTLRLAAVFRYVLANTERQFTSVSEELEFARSYLDIEEARFEDRLKVRFDVEPSVLQERVPTLLLQPLIENALKHGLSPKRQGGTLSILARRTVSGIELTVSDDGVGLQTKKQESHEPGTHVGLRNVRQRLQTAYEGRATFLLKPREGGGTEATVLINQDKEESR